jgi:hypothetical protein
MLCHPVLEIRPQVDTAALLAEGMKIKLHMSNPDHPRDGDRLFWMAKFFNLDFRGTKFTVPKRSLFDLFEHQRDLFDATSYVVQSSVPVEVFELFVKALETGEKVPVTKENAGSISLLAKEFWLEDLLSECSALQMVSIPKLIADLSQPLTILSR